MFAEPTGSGGGEREASITRQMPFEPFASVLLALVFGWFIPLDFELVEQLVELSLRCGRENGVVLVVQFRRSEIRQLIATVAHQNVDLTIDGGKAEAVSGHEIAGGEVTRQYLIPEEINPSVGLGGVINPQLAKDGKVMKSRQLLKLPGPLGFILANVRAINGKQ